MLTKVSPPSEEHVLQRELADILANFWPVRAVKVNEGSKEDGPSRQWIPMSHPNDFWQARRVFVTGCTGLVGAWTVQPLKERGPHWRGLVPARCPRPQLYPRGYL